MKTNFKKLEQFARERGYTVIRRGRIVLWKCNSSPGQNGICFSMVDAMGEIQIHYKDRLLHACA